jgi:diguanylate cyclase (GGDEF)-like protein
MSSYTSDYPVILIIDHRLERAIQLSNIISNSGINIRTKMLSTPFELESALRESQPTMALVSSGAFEPNQAVTVVRWLTERNIPLVLSLDETDMSFMCAALKTTPCRVVHSADSKHWSAIINQILGRQEAENLSTATQHAVDDLQHRFRLLFDHSGEAIAYIHEGFHVDANRAYLDYLHLESIEELAGRSILELMRGIDTDLKELLREIGRGHFPDQPVGVIIRDSAGEEFMGDIRLSGTRYQGEDCAQLLLREVDQNARLRQAVSARRTRDSLTGCLNRASFLPMLTGYLTQSNERQASNALLYLKPDRFDEYQDTLGYAAADQFLAEFAAIVNRCLSDSDVACRFTDDGLVVLLRRSNDEPLEPIARAILDATAEHSVNLEPLTLQTRCSIGMVTLCPALCSADEAISQARMAWRDAMEQGNQLVRYKPRLSMVALDASSRAGWRERLRFGLDHGNFYSLQHTVANLEDESRGYLETRSYLREEQGDVEQLEFMSAADACNMGAELNRAILPGLLDTIANQPSSRKHILNLSTGSAVDEGFPAWFGQQLAQRAISGDRLLLLFPTDSVLSDPSRAAQIADELRQLGCQFALSGFGNEPRHLRLLGSPGVSLVRLDPALSRELATDEEQRARVRSVVTAANAAGVEVMVDEIRDAGHLAALWQCGIKLVAGEFLQEASQVVGQ